MSNPEYRFTHLPTGLFFSRLLKHFLVVMLLLLVVLGAGMLGYHYYEGLGWLDALLNASMILGGMGPVDTIRTANGKVFASVYALFSGLFVLVAAGLMMTPIAHRVLHRFHMDDEDKPGDA